MVKLIEIYFSISTIEDEGDTIYYNAFTVSKQKRGKEVINSKFDAVFNLCKISDENSIHTLTTVVEALEHEVNEFIINRYSL